MSRPWKWAPLRVCALALVAGAACNSAARPTALDRLHPCKSGEGITDAYCGTFTVFEDRAAGKGRTIDLNIVVLPALAADSKPDPLFFLAGGPGQGAAKMARGLRQLFRRVQTTRDIVLVDQRGTGKSNPMDCPSDDESLKQLNETDEVGLERIKTCLASINPSADPRFYTTTIAMDDLDDVRGYLGYDQINVYGGSYGTRAALVYLRQHEPRVRTVVLDGVAPTDMRLPLFFARDAQRSLDHLVADCAADAVCSKKFPDFGARIVALFARLSKTPAHVRLVHPRTGLAEEIDVDARFVANTLAGALYSPLMSSLLPELVIRAEGNDFQGMLALAMMGESASDEMSLGMQLSVVCAEDYPRIAPDEAQRASAGTVFAGHLLTARMRACEFWPRGAVDAAYYQPVTSAVPTLVLSGEIDPVTPPSWGQSVADHLSKSRHIVAPATGHGVVTSACGMKMIREFIDAGSVDGLDVSCVQSLRRPAFFLLPAGPDPTAVPGKGSP
jgi:pimeloyl-ACP methyl ester carboxylesterase